MVTLKFRFSAELLCSAPGLVYIHLVGSRQMEGQAGSLPACPSICPSITKNRLTLQQQGGKVAACPQVTGSCKTLILPLLWYWTGHQCSESEAQQRSLTWSMKQQWCLLRIIVYCESFFKKDCKQQYKLVQIYILISLKQIHDYITTSRFWTCKLL